jgi:hypothetical protein
MLPNGAEAGRDVVPWSLVGSGWTVALWSSTFASRPGQSSDAGPSHATLYLVDPLGGRYAIQAFPADAVPYMIVDWSGDGRRVLFQKLGTYQVTELDLSTGASHGFEAKSLADRYTLPAGRAILMRPADGSAAFYRVGLEGTVQMTYPSTEPAAGALRWPIYTSDGAQLVFGGEHGLVVVGNSGAIVRDLPGTVDLSWCTPTRMWTDAQVLASCQSTGTSALWLFPIAGAPRPSWLVPVAAASARATPGRSQIGHTPSPGVVADMCSCPPLARIVRPAWFPCPGWSMALR